MRRDCSSSPPTSARLPPPRFWSGRCPGRGGSWFRRKSFSASCSPFSSVLSTRPFTARPFARPWLNEAVAWFTGFVIFLPSTWFRYFHFEHHRFTHVEGADPELDTPKPATRLSFLFYLSGLESFWWSFCKTLLRHAAGRVTDRYVPDDAARRACVLQARLYLAGYAAILAAAVWAGDPAPLLYWIIPLGLSAWSLRLYLMAEHTLLPFSADMLDNTRTIRTNAAVRWLAWQMPYHTEHHVFPSIPFHTLHRACDRIAPRHGHVIAGYLAFAREYWASLAPGAPEEGSGENRR